MNKKETKSTQSYQITLTTLEPLHIGGKPDPLSGTGNPVSAVAGRPVIPGTSLKGAYRAELESYLIKTHYDPQTKKWKVGKEVLKPCIPGTKLSDDENELVREGLYINTSCHYPCNIHSRKHGKETHSICPVCYLLGAQGLVGFVKIPFLFPEDMLAEELYSARIDRKLSTVMEGTNRPYQLIPDGAKFSGELVITLEDQIFPDKWTLGKPRKLKSTTDGDAWLKNQSIDQDDLIREFIIERLEHINTLGGFKSKGFGEVKIKLSPKS